MNSTQISKRSLVLIILIPLIIIAFLLLSPTVSPLLFPAKRTASLQTFIKDTANEKRLDTKRFWQMREFYSPGSFVFKKEGFTKQNTLFPKTHKLVFLEYSAPQVTSYESLVAEAEAPEMLSQLAKIASGKKILAKGDNFIIFQSANNKVMIVFLANTTEMQQANGFFEYNDEEDSALVKDKSWLSVSEFVY